MTIGALIDRGFDLERLKQKLRLLPLEGYRLSATKCLRAGIHATKFDVEVVPVQHAHNDQAGHHGRTFREIRAMIESSGLSAWVKEKSVEAFFRLAVAEGKIHNQTPADVHFHEVGAIDSIVDIVGSMVAFEELLPARIVSSPVNIGYGTLECRHGTYPVPGPATQELLRGIPVYSNAVGGELTTPTGATILATLVERFGARPLMRIDANGYGAGTRDTAGNANVLRITVGEELAVEAQPSPDEQVAVIEATIDDMNPQIYGYFQERVLALGALDVYLTPVQMKKNRPGHLLTVVCAPAQTDSIVGLIFAETTTIGVRHTAAGRTILAREIVTVETEYGSVRIKVSALEGCQVNFAPEYEDCRRLAEEKRAPLKEILAAASRAYLELEGKRRRENGDRLRCPQLPEIAPGDHSPRKLGTP
jgi:uncharacterized protein (TIGR00299 family) protein